jgi:ATP-dependent DNA helicase RecQ
MATSSILGGERPPVEPKGTDEDSLGPERLERQRQRCLGTGNRGACARPGGGHRARAGRPAHAGGDAHRRRQVAVLPAAGAAARRPHGGGLAADRADEGPVRVAARARHRAVQVNSALDAEELRAGRAAIADGSARIVMTTPERLADPAFLQLLRRAPGQRCWRSTRRTASRNGATTSGRPSWRSARRCRPGQPAGAGADGHRQRRRGRRHDEAAGHPAAGGRHRRLPPNLPARRAGGGREGDKLRARSSWCVRQPGSGIVYAATVKARSRRCTRRWRPRRVGGAVPRQARRARAQRGAGGLHGGRVRVMVATNAFGLGIDKPDIRFVLHYQMPRAWTPTTRRPAAPGATASARAARCCSCAATRRCSSSSWPASHARRLQGAARCKTARRSSAWCRTRSRASAAGTCCWTISIPRMAMKRCGVCDNSALPRKKPRAAIVPPGTESGFCFCFSCHRWWCSEAADTARRWQASTRRIAADRAAPAFAASDPVRVKRFGEGVVVAADAGSITVAFADGSQRCFHPDYVSRRRAARASAARGAGRVLLAGLPG